MRSLILAGGVGKRLRPITHTGAKQLVPVANKPILFYGIEAMVAAGIVEIGVIVGDTADEVMEAVGDGAAFGAKITYIRQDAPLGLAHCVMVAREFLGDEDFVMYLGDNLLQQDVAQLAADFERTQSGPNPPAAQILLKAVPDPHLFGVVTIDDDGNAVRVVEKPEHPASDLALVGVYFFDRRIHEAVRSIEPSARNELEISDAIQWLIDNGHPVRTARLQGWWIDTGNLTPLLEANRLLLERIETELAGDIDDETSVDGRVIVARGAVVRRSRIRGPVAIAAGTTIVNSFVGPFTAIGVDCHVENSEIEHSVVMAGSRIEDIPRLEDSLIGREATVSRTQSRPRALRLMVGDHCHVDVE